MTKDESRFFTAFKDNIDQYPLTLEQYVDFLNGVDDAVYSETYTALADARNMWSEAQNTGGIK